MSAIPHPSTARTDSSSKTSGKLVPCSADSASEADVEVHFQASDKDYAIGDSDESEDSSPSSENDFYSDSLEKDRSERPKRKAGPSTAKNKQRKHTSETNVRSIEAATSRTKDSFSHISPEMSGGFKFLHLESYICHCASPSLSRSAPPRCKVLAYFALVFLESLGAVYCPSHNQIIPMAEWATHVRRSHLDWSSKTKKSECVAMARHVADGHNLSMDQTADDLNLPDEIDEPLSTNTSNLNLNYRCPLGCGQWMVEDKGSNFPERFIREKHIRNNCPEGVCLNYKDIHLDEPRWIFKVRISGKKVKFHCFVLPLEWERSDDGELTAFPEPPLLDDITPLVDLDGRQEWPLTLGWRAYDQEISANDHVVALRSLILLPRCDCKASPNSHFLEKGLHLVDHAIIKYLRSAVSFIHEKHKGVVDVITLECVLLNSKLCPINNILNSSKKAKFRILSDGKFSEYRMPFSMVICMMLNFIHAVLTDDTEQFGGFKLRGVQTQVIAALALYRLIVNSQGDVPTNDLDWATHDVLETLLKPVGLGTRPVDCPTDQMAFLWAFLSRNRYRISKDLSSLMAGCKFGFRCIEIHAARVRAQKRQKGSSFYDDLPYAGCDEDDSEMLQMQEKNRYAARDSREPDIVTLLAKVNTINPEGT
jgi:hypothetical protein